MDRFVNFMSNNALVSTLTGAAVLAILAWTTKTIRDRRDSKAIYDFLAESTSATKWDYRTTEAIASETNLSESRVAHICAGNPKIRRNGKQLQSWTLVD